MGKIFFIGTQNYRTQVCFDVGTVAVILFQVTDCNIQKTFILQTSLESEYKLAVKNVITCTKELCTTKFYISGIVLPHQLMRIHSQY